MWKYPLIKKNIRTRFYGWFVFVLKHISIISLMEWCYIHTEVGLDPVYIKNMLTECEYDFSYMQLLRNNNFHGSSFVEGG